MNEALTGRVGRHLLSWGTGRAPAGATPALGTATVVLEDAGHLPALRESGVVASGSVVFAPASPAAEEQAGVAVFGYDGSLSESGEEAVVAETVYLRTQDYATTGFVSLVESTLVRITDDGDFEAYLADADRARAEGEFAEFTTSLAVQIADLGALGADAAGDGPLNRLYVSGTGELSTSPGGLRLGSVGENPQDLVAAWERITATAGSPGAVALGAAVPEDRRSAALRERPWLGRYLATLEMVRVLRRRGVAEVRVSGFGDRLVPALLDRADAADLTGAELPVLAWTPDTCYLRAPQSGRIFELGRPMAESAELLMACAGVAAAAEYADRPALERVAEFFDRNGIALAAAQLTGAGV